tara:strand:- start:374 stop:577 length:204 start_codon:yes stop_codon:yes gene_type:complete
MFIGQKITVSCTDTNKSVLGTIVRIQKGVFDVEISDSIIKMFHKKENLYIGNMHGLEFTAIDETLKK